jgi:hypothetical protein
VLDGTAPMRMMPGNAATKTGLSLRSKRSVAFS